jgi:hypothetical protein
MYDVLSLSWHDDSFVCSTVWPGCCCSGNMCRMYCLCTLFWQGSSALPCQHALTDRPYNYHTSLLLQQHPLCWTNKCCSGACNGNSVAVAFDLVLHVMLFFVVSAHMDAVTTCAAFCTKWYTLMSRSQNSTPCECHDHTQCLYMCACVCVCVDLAGVMCHLACSTLMPCS